MEISGFRENKISYALDDILNMKNIYLKIYLIVEQHPLISRKDQYSSFRHLIETYKSNQFVPKNIDTKIADYLLMTSPIDTDLFLNCISLLDLNKSQVKRLKTMFSYSEIFRLFKSAIKSQKSSYRLIYLIMLILDNPNLCFNNLLPVLSRINMYISKGIDRNFVACLNILRAVSEIGDIIDQKEEYFTGLISFLVNVATDPKNYIFIEADGMLQLLETVDKLVFRRQKSTKLTNIAVGIFLRLQEELFEVPMATYEEKICMGCRLKLMTIFYRFTYKSGCRMYDYEELTTFLLNLSVDNDFTIECKYQLLDEIISGYLNEFFNETHNESVSDFKYQANKVNQLSNNKNRESEVSLITIDSNISVKDSFSIYSTCRNSLNSIEFTKGLIRDLEKVKNIQNILNKIKNTSNLINWDMLLPVSIQKSRDFIKFMASLLVAKNSLIFAQKLASRGDEDGLLLFAYFLNHFKSHDYQLLAFLINWKAADFSKDLRIQKRICIVARILCYDLNCLKNEALNEFVNFFCKNLKNLNLVVLAVVGFFMKDLDDKLFVSIMKLIIKLSSKDLITCSFVAFTLVKRKINPIYIKTKRNYCFVLISLLYHIKIREENSLASSKNDSLNKVTDIGFNNSKEIIEVKNNKEIDDLKFKNEEIQHYDILENKNVPSVRHEEVKNDNKNKVNKNNNKKSARIKNNKNMIEGESRLENDDCIEKKNGEQNAIINNLENNDANSKQKFKDEAYKITAKSSKKEEKLISKKKFLGKSFKMDELNEMIIKWLIKGREDEIGEIKSLYSILGKLNLNSEKSDYLITYEKIENVFKKCGFN